MKILIAVSSKEYSGPTLSVGMNVSRAFKAPTTIVDVGEKINEFSTKDVGMAHERIESWDFDRPGVDVLEWAFDYLADKEFIESSDIEAGFPKNTLVDTGGNRCEVYLKGTVCDNVSLILRNGDIIAELKDEVQKHHYDVTIIGGSQIRRMAHDLIQYIDSSIFVVNKYDLNQKICWLIQAESPREILAHALQKQGAKIISTPVYQNIPAEMDCSFLLAELEKNNLDWILFASPSAVQNFQNILPDGFWLYLITKPKIACLGEFTSEAVQSLGWKVEAKPSIQDFEHLVQTLCEIYLKNIYSK